MSRKPRCVQAVVFDENVRQQFLEWALEWRGIDTPCPKCQGSGVTIYGSTSTWHGGMGGSSMTGGECDECWGSGDQRRHWTDHRSQSRQESKRIAEGAVSLLASVTGTEFASMRPTIEALCGELDRLARTRPRTPRPRYFADTCESLARTLRAGIESAR